MDSASLVNDIVALLDNNSTAAAANPPSFNCTLARVSIITGLKLTIDAVNGLDAGGLVTTLSSDIQCISFNFLLLGI
jgi:hypothetical protein